MRSLRFILLVGVVAGFAGCSAPPAAPVKTDSGSPPGGGGPNPPPAFSVAGTWMGRASDLQGDAVLEWVLTQSGNAITGSATSRTATPGDGSCGSCHKNKFGGSVSGVITGTKLILTMAFPGGNEAEQTPMCSATVELPETAITDQTVVGRYTGGDSCEGVFDGMMAMDHISRPIPGSP
jgi:hypothetical protein